MQGGIGELNPCPMQVGGGPTPTSKAYALILKAVGEGGSAKNDRGIEGLWRRSKAAGLAAATSSVERAVLQLDPGLATDFLPYYERATGLVPDGEAAASTRAAEARVRWTRQIDAIVASIGTELARIDARLTLIDGDHATAATTQEGRAFGAHDSADEGPEYGGPGYALLPNYSTDFVLRVSFAVGHTGTLTQDELRVLATVRGFLRDVLPSWWDFTVSTGSWLLGSTPIGCGTLG